MSNNSTAEADLSLSAILPGVFLSLIACILCIAYFICRKSKEPYPVQVDLNAHPSQIGRKMYNNLAVLPPVEAGTSPSLIILKRLDNLKEPSP